MATSKEKQKYIAIGVVLFIIILIVVFRTKITDLFLPSAQPNPTATGGQSTTVINAALDYNKVLQNGSRGEEVKVLQTMLGGLTADGNFGPKTEAALVERKGVHTVSLNQFSTLADLAPHVSGAGGSWSNSSYPTVSSVFNPFSWIS